MAVQTAVHVHVHEVEAQRLEPIRERAAVRTRGLRWFDEHNDPAATLAERRDWPEWCGQSRGESQPCRDGPQRQGVRWQESRDETTCLGLSGSAVAQV